MVVNDKCSGLMFQSINTNGTFKIILTVSLAIVVNDEHSNLMCCSMSANKNRLFKNDSWTAIMIINDECSSLLCHSISVYKK